MALIRFDDPAVPVPCRVVDANGLEWPDVTEVDTETGRISQVMRDKDGQAVFWDGRVTTHESFVAAPVHVIPVGDGKWG